MNFPRPLPLASRLSLLWSVLLFVPLLAAFAGTADTVLPPGEQARRFQRNRLLIQSLVQSGLRLASETDPLKRAHCCTGLAESLADEIQRAAVEKEGTRVEELGSHLHALLEGGIALNLSHVRNSIPPGSADEQKLREIRDHTLKVVNRLQQRLRTAAATENGEELQRTLKAVDEGRAKIERAAQGRISSTSP